MNGVLTKYLYDGEDILAEYNSSGTRLARYTHGPGIDEPLIMQRGSQNYYYHADGLGSITELTDTSGTIVNSYVYNAFGQIVKQTEGVANPYVFTSREQDKESGLYFYRARYMDPRIGRFLQPDPVGLGVGPISRLCPDPSGSIGGINLNIYMHLAMNQINKEINLYHYSMNNPINNTDPTGLKTVYTKCDPGWKCAAAVPPIPYPKMCVRTCICYDDECGETSARPCLQWGYMYGPLGGPPSSGSF
ncbi:MAG: RHS repeat-associated core domain-containing protein [bacterium]